ncbi:bZIP transcription factor 1 [Phytophthora ramorum]
MKLSPDKLKETHKRKRVDAGKSRRREQCRANQARYRDKQRNAQLQLEKSVELLHAELDALKRRYRDLLSRERSNQSPWSIVAEVFRLLESSFRFPWRTTNAQEMSHHQNTRQILAVLERSFAHDAAMGKLSGAKCAHEAGTMLFTVLR